MSVIQTSDLSPTSPLPPHITHQVYCGLDSCLAHEVRQEEEPLRLHRPLTSHIYNFERALQAPYLEIMQRGFLVNGPERFKASLELRSRIDRLQNILNRLAFPIWQRQLNSRSPTQLRDFFYHHLRLPEVWISQKGERKLSTNREALEKLESYLYARPFISCILTIRDLSKQLEVFENEIDSDGRFRTSYNIAGTETGRPSSSSNAFGTGGNAQNIAPSLRYIFVADHGYKLGQVDLEQVEARDVGFFCGCLFNDWSYLDACESGDLHTNNARRIWPERAWTGSPNLDRKMAEENFYRDFSFRDMAKRGSHLSNYMGTAWTASRALKVPIAIMEDFQARYCRGGRLHNGPCATPAFPCIPRFWQWIAQQIQTTYSLTTPFGRERHFFGRPSDDTTLREAIAFLPQSTTADRMNLGLWRVWKHERRCQLLAQTYDSITFQYRQDADEDSILQSILELIKVELLAPSGRSYVVPGEVKIGWNWGNQVTETDCQRATKEGKKVPKLNPLGLAKWVPGQPDRRTAL